MKPLCDFWFSSVLRTCVLLWHHDTLNHGSFFELDVVPSCGTLQSHTRLLCKWLVPLACPLDRVYKTPFLQSAFASQLHPFSVLNLRTSTSSVLSASGVTSSVILFASSQVRRVASSMSIGWTIPFRVGLLATLLGWTIVLILTQVYYIVK